MIKPEELRIGNCIQFRDWTKEEKYVVGNIISLDVWHPNKSATIIYSDNENALGAKNTGMNFDKLVPILLTPEILTKCGLEEDISSGYVWHKIPPHYLIEISEGQVSFVILVNKEKHHVWHGLKPPYCRFKYLHQLQNLYFALTGEELIYKP